MHLTEQQKERVRELYAQGVSADSLAYRFGCTKCTIWNTLKHVEKKRKPMFSRI